MQRQGAAVAPDRFAAWRMAAIRPSFSRAFGIWWPGGCGRSHTYVDLWAPASGCKYVTSPPAKAGMTAKIAATPQPTGGGAETTWAGHRADDRQGSTLPIWRG